MHAYIYTVSNVYFYVKNNETKMCTNHVLHKEIFNTPVRKDLLKGKNSLQGKCNNYVRLFGPLLYFNPKKVFHNN